MGTSDLPEMYAQSLRTQPEEGKSQVLMLQLLCNTRLRALMSIQIRPLGSLYMPVYACLKGPIMVMQQVELQ